MDNPHHDPWPGGASLGFLLAPNSSRPSWALDLLRFEPDSPGVRHHPIPPTGGPAASPTIACRPSLAETHSAAHRVRLCSFGSVQALPLFAAWDFFASFGRPSLSPSSPPPPTRVQVLCSRPTATAPRSERHVAYRAGCPIPSLQSLRCLLTCMPSGARRYRQLDAAAPGARVRNRLAQECRNHSERHRGQRRLALVFGARAHGKLPVPPPPSLPHSEGRSPAFMESLLDFWGKGARGTAQRLDVCGR